MSQWCIIINIGGRYEQQLANRVELNGQEILAHAINHNFESICEGKHRLDAHRLMATLEREVGQ